jgi:hypothetical protein
MNVCCILASRGVSSVVGRGLPDHDQQRIYRHSYPACKRHMLCMCRIMLSSVVCLLGLPHFSTFPKTTFQKEFIVNKNVCIFIFSKTF